MMLTVAILAKIFLGAMPLMGMQPHPSSGMMMQQAQPPSSGMMAQQAQPPSSGMMAQQAPFPSGGAMQQPRQMPMPPPQMMAMGGGGIPGQVTAMCATAGPEAVVTIPCQTIGQQDILGCFSTPGRDDTLTELVRRCPMSIPQDIVPLAMAAKMSNKPMSLAALLNEQGRCNAQTPEIAREQMLQQLVATNDPVFVQIVLQACQINPMALMSMSNVARQHGWMAVVPLLDQAARSGSGSGSGGMAVNPGQAAASGPTLDPNILLNMSPMQMSQFGAVGDVCAGLTADHFRNARNNYQSLSSMNGNCFRFLRPDAFDGMNGDQVGALQHWPLATPDQVSKLGVSAVTRIPFGQLGRYPQRSSSDAFHPCYGITKMQRMSIRMHGDAYKAYKARCTISANVARGKRHDGQAMVALAMAILCGILLL